jgi:protein-tyrosine kinase
MDRIKRALEKNKTRKQHAPTVQSVPARQSAPDPDATIILPHDDIVYSQTQVTQSSNNALAENRIIAGNKSDPRASYFRMLRTQVLHAMRENEWSSLAVTGPLAGVGKSLIAANLAISISMEVNQTVLLVDLDLRRPSLHEKFNFVPEKGLLDYLTYNAELPELLVNPGFPRFVLLPGKGSTSESSELLSSPRMLKLFKELKSRYESRIVIYDLPPLLNVEDAQVIIPNVDATILVVENGKNTKSEVQKSLQLLEGTNLIGTVLNKADEEIKGYY